MAEIKVPKKYEPIGPMQYFWLSVLFSIPVVGFVFLIVFSCSSSNINRRNYARSFWVPYAIMFVLVIILIASGATLGGILEYLQQNAA